MRPSVPRFAAILLLVALPLFAVSPTVVDDVIRMSKAGVADDTIVAFVQAKDDAFDISADDVVAMKKAGVSAAVIRAIIDEAAAHNPQLQAAAEPPPPPAPAVEQQPAEQSDSGGTNVVVASAPIPDYLWDPWWYMPKLDTKSGAPAPAAKGAPAGAAPAAAPRPAEARGRHIESAPILEGVARAVAAAAQAIGHR